jgi:5-methylcytosine-specific restriction endonuclease McrA
MSGMSKNWRQDLRNKLYERDGRKCHYCGIEELDFTKLWGKFYGGRKREKLEIDRKDNRPEYDIEYCVLACPICNNAKSDKFTYEEFKKVGNVIREIWQERKRSRVGD